MKPKNMSIWIKCRLAKVCGQNVGREVQILVRQGLLGHSHMFLRPVRCWTLQEMRLQYELKLFVSNYGESSNMAKLLLLLWQVVKPYRLCVCLFFIVYFSSLVPSKSVIRPTKPRRTLHTTHQPPPYLQLSSINLTSSSMCLSANCGHILCCFR